MRCPACLAATEDSFESLSEHIYNSQLENSGDHIMWINRYVTRNRVSPEEFVIRIRELFEFGHLKTWVLEKFIKKFYSESPHMFLLKMQRPDKWTLLGYAYEHHHFLKQWVKSCSSIIANTDIEEVQHYEIDNILSEWQGVEGKFPSHHELLLRMGESYGASRTDIYKTEPLRPTIQATATWDTICRNFSFIEGMAAMHTLELIANRKMKEYGASMGYFDPVILTDGSVTKETVDFLKEGYLADVSHSEIALDIISRYAASMGLEQEVQAVVMRSMEEFDSYLNARLERGVLIENEQY